MEQLLYYVHYTILLIFGIVISAAFSGVAPTRRNGIRLFYLTLLCGGLQLSLYRIFGESAVWQLYPVITHLPIVLSLRFFFGRNFSGAVTAMASAYLCCQPAKWFGLAALAATGSLQAELLVRIASLVITAAILLRWIAWKIARICERRYHSSWVFGIIPVTYYLFDYSVAIYSSLWTDNHQLVVEFLPCFLCIGHLIFCSVYYREYELKSEAERKEQLLRITVDQQTKEVEMIRRSEGEIRHMRHDLKLFLNSLSSCIEQSDKETARKLIAGFSSRAEASAVKRYCRNDTLNYVLSDYAAQCQEKGIRFHATVELANLTVDEILFSTILANALDNARNAQNNLPSDQRSIRLMLKNSGGKVLLCVKNRFSEKPLFRDGIPVTTRKGHGYGIQSIRYVTEKLGGNCQFTLEDDWFVLRVVV